MPAPHHLVCLLATLILGCASVPTIPQAQQVEGETISLRFGWEPGATAQVSSKRKVVDWGARGPETQQIELRYSLTAEPGAEGSEGMLLLRRGEVQIEGMPSVRDARAAELVARELGQPDLLIGPHGTLEGIYGSARVQATAASLVGRLAKAGPVSDGFKERIESLFSDEGLQRRSAEAWGELVGLWSGGELEVGKIYHARDRRPIDALGGIGLEMLFEMRLIGRVPCSGDDRTNSCVQLELVARPDPGQHSRLLAFVSTLFPHRASDVRIEERIVLISEPEGLRPHSFQAKRKVEIPFVGSGQSPPGEFQQIDEQAIVFSWPKRALAQGE